jgi:hypothetical protein
MRRPTPSNRGEVLKLFNRIFDSTFPLWELNVESRYRVSERTIKTLEKLRLINDEFWEALSELDDRLKEEPLQNAEKTEIIVGTIAMQVKNLLEMCSPRLKETVLRIVLRYFRKFQRENIRL